MRDKKSKAFRVVQRQIAKEVERNDMETHCSQHAMEWCEPLRETMNECFEEID